MSKTVWLFLILILFSLNIQGQYRIFSNFGESAFADVKYHTGKPIVYSDSLNTSLQHQFFAIDYRFGINSFGRMPQDFILGYPNYGIGFTHYAMHSDSIGNPMGLYGFFAAPWFINSGRFRSGFELSAGFSFNFNSFDLVSNPKNDLIGSQLNVYFNLGIWGSYKISERLDALTSIDFTHFSNGTMNTPNKGLNLWGGNIGLRYHFQFPKVGEKFERKQSSLTKNSFEKLKPHFEASVWAAIGGKTVITPTHEGPVYFCTSISTDFSRRYGWLGRAGIGFDYFYDHSLTHNSTIENNDKPLTNSFIGLHGSHDFIVGDFSLALQIGSYLWKGREAKGGFYIRSGLKYDLGRHLFLNLSLKSQNGFKADYIELGLGYRFGKKEN